MPATPTATPNSTAREPIYYLDTEVFDRLAAVFGATNNAARARLVGIDRKTLWRYRTGQQQPGIEVAQRIATALRTSVDQLFPRRAA